MTSDGIFVAVDHVLHVTVTSLFDNGVVWMMLTLGNTLIFARARSLASRAAALTIVAAVTGCGGGGGSMSSLPTVSATNVGANVAGANLTITIPSATSASAKMRHALYISNATNSATFTPSGGSPVVIPLSSGSPNCTTVAGGRSCTIAVSLSSGSSVSFTISTFASLDGTGTPLSTTQATQAIVASKPNAINVTLNAVVSQLGVALSTVAFTIGTAGTSAVNVNAMDASGAIIAVGQNNLVDANDNAVTVTLSDSESSATQLSSTTLSATPVTLSYNGGTPSVGTAVVKATASSSATPSLSTASASFGISGASSGSTAGLPPFGVYTSCEIDTNLAACEADDLEMTKYGLTTEINYLSAAAHKTGANSLQALAQYDASIGMMQWINLKSAVSDADALTGTSLVGGSLGNDCGATNNQQVVQCIETTLSSVSGFKYGFYIYDEPGCPESIGYCAASLGGYGNPRYKNIEELAAYIQSISTRPVLGIQAGGGGTTSANQNLFSCNSACGGSYYISGPHSPNTGGDDYPISGDPVASKAGLAGVGTNVQNIVQVLSGPTSGNAAETMSWVGQAFSWFQESPVGAFGCTSMTTCPMITETQLQEQRDEALYYAKAGGKPIQYFFWYYWPDLKCLDTNNTVATTPNCDPATNLNALKTADQAPFPTSPPVIQ